MILFIKLFLAHINADFILQPNAWVTHKEQQKGKSIFLVWHILIHFVLYALFIFKLDFLIYAAIIALLHGIIDFVKLKISEEKNKKKLVYNRSVYTLSPIVLCGFLLYQFTAKCI